MLRVEVHVRDDRFLLGGTHPSISFAKERYCTEVAQIGISPFPAPSVGVTHSADRVRPSGREHAVQNDRANRRCGLRRCAHAAAAR